MSKPLYYYAGESNYLDYLQEIYGSTFIGLTKVQKLALLSHVANTLLNVEISLQGTAIVDEELNEAYSICDDLNKELTIGYFIGLADALVNQIKHQH